VCCIIECSSRKTGEKSFQQQSLATFLERMMIISAAEQDMRANSINKKNVLKKIRALSSSLN
jgi:hypothetical protein